MFIKSLKIENFRNHEISEISFSPKLNIIYGDNAQGKTNILEALYFNSAGKSHRCGFDKEMISFGKEKAKILMEYYANKRFYKNEIEIFNNKRKSIKINGVELKKTGDLIGILNMVLFSPEDLDIVKGGPQERRNFLDNSISQLRPKYYSELIKYNKILLQRNKLLKEIQSVKSYKETLDVWDEKLAMCGTELIIHRHQYTDILKGYASKIHSSITGEDLEIEYKPSFNYNNLNKKDIKEDFLKKLKANYDEDFKNLYTSIGPQRDDLEMFINKKNIKDYASQGQKRTVILTLKLSEIEFVYEDKGEYPVVLLDDVMSELDIKRQKYILNYLKDKQVIITCNRIKKQLTNNETSLLYVKEGRVTK